MTRPKHTFLAWLGLLVLGAAGLSFALGRGAGQPEETSAVLERPAQLVFRWLHEPARRQQWVSERRGITEAVTALEPPRRLAMHLDGEDFAGDVEYTLEEQDGRTRLRYRSATRPKQWLARLLAGRDDLGRVKSDLAVLKGLIEREPPIAPRTATAGQSAFRGCCAAAPSPSTPSTAPTPPR